MPDTAPLMKRSPLDVLPFDPTSHQGTGSKPQTRGWKPSRFNARTVAADGRVVLWNTYTTAISVFAARYRDALDALLVQTGTQGPLPKIGHYLSERGYLVPTDIDEMRRFRDLFGRQHYRTDRLELILMSSEDCNFRCKYCYEDFKRGTMRPDVREGVKRYVDGQARLLREAHINWFGGEPLYGFDAIADLAPYFNEVFARHDISYRSAMTTNGYLLTPETATSLLGWNIRDFQITLDGLADTHDKSRVARDGGKTFDVIFDNLKAMSKRRDEFHITLRTNYDQANQPQLERYLTSIHDAFGEDSRFAIRLRPVDKWGGKNDSNLTVCGKEDVRDVRSRVEALVLANGMHVADGIQDVNKPGSYVCYAARPFNFLIGADGQVMKCTIVLDKEDYNVVGQLTSDGVMRLDRDKMQQWTHPAFETDTMCQSCHLLPPCQGLTCPLHRIQKNERECCEAKGRLHQLLVRVADEPRRRGTSATLVGSRDQRNHEVGTSVLSMAD